MVICPIDKNRDHYTKNWLLAPNIQIFGSKKHIFAPRVTLWCFPRLWLLVGSDRPTDQGTDRQTMSVIELSWTAKKLGLCVDVVRSTKISTQRRQKAKIHLNKCKNIAQISPRDSFPSQCYWKFAIDSWNALWKLVNKQKSEVSVVLPVSQGLLNDWSEWGGGVADAW